MNKVKLNPLTLDKETIARLNANQLSSVLGGFVGRSSCSNCCEFGGSTCSIVNGGSTGCGAGSSVCIAAGN